MTTDFRALCAELVETFKDENTYTQRVEILDRARAALATSPRELPKNCWLDDEPDLFPSPCVFDDPSEVINNCIYARAIKCKTDCKYYRVAAHPEPVQAPPPEPPTAIEIIDLSIEIDDAGLGIVEFARAALERWGNNAI